MKTSRPGAGQLQVGSGISLTIPPERRRLRRRRRRRRRRGRGLGCRSNGRRSFSKVLYIVTLYRNSFSKVLYTVTLCSEPFSKVLYIVTLYRKYTRTVTFENFFRNSTTPSSAAVAGSVPYRIRGGREEGREGGREREREHVDAGEVVTPMSAPLILRAVDRRCGNCFPASLCVCVMERRSILSPQFSPEQRCGVGQE